ncbi:MAG TPA: tetratricopeptide repeat protein, partial [Pyrinomonadaceae bacterium]|nr:tetratricopeptide repeat protein [Pyrinomonadaceae bacterium]
PKLHSALRGELPRAEAQALLDAVKDLSALNRDLLTRLQSAGFNVADGNRSVAVSGDDNLAVTGDDNLVVEHAEGDVVRGNKIVQESPRPIIPTLHQLRAPVGDFVGREKEIAELLSTLRGGKSAAITGISGMGGIGKTELSFHVAERLRDAYPDAQLVLDMRGTDERPRDPSDALASCIRAFVGLEQRLPDDTEQLTRLYRSVLEGKRALILLDNASDSAQVRPLLPPKGSALLVTSRETVPIPGMKRVTLEQLRPAEARALLTSIAPHVPASVADRICYLCGYLPLAVRAAASLLDITPDLDPEVYAAQLSDERTRLERIGVDPTIGIDVEASIGLSYQRLPPDAARVFRQLAVFPATFDAAAEEAVCEDESHTHLSEFLRRSLVLFNADTRRYRLHDLTRLFADSRLSRDERDVGLMRHSEHYLEALNKASEFYLRGGDAIERGLALADLEWRNIQAGQSWAEKQSAGDDVAAALCSAYAHIGFDMRALRQHPREQIAWLTAALAAARKLNNRADEGAHLGNLGYIYDDLGEYSLAVDYYNQCLPIIREYSDRTNEGRLLGLLGVAYYNLGEPYRAIQFYQQQLLIAQEIGDRRSEAQALGNQGTIQQALGEPRVAIELYERRLTISRMIGDRHGEGQTLGNLGAAYLDLGEYGQCILFCEQRLKIAREMGDLRGQAYALFNISQALNLLGDHAEAIARAEMAIEIFERIESPEAAKVRAALARWRGEA